MKTADIKIGEIYAVKEGSTPSAGTISFSTIYRLRVNRIGRVRNVRVGGSPYHTTYVYGQKLRHVDDTPLYGSESESKFTPQMVLSRWEDR